jgi:hypothetical protein
MKAAKYAGAFRKTGMKILGGDGELKFGQIDGEKGRL